jgi:hypothetical protein
MVPCAGAGQHGAQSVSLHRDRDRLVLVGEQQHFRGQREHPRHLPDYADVIDHGLAGGDAVLAALVDDHPARKGIARRIQDLGDAALDRLPRAHVEQRAHALVFLFEMFLAQQQVGGAELTPTQLLVFPQQACLARQVGAEVAGSVDRHPGQALQRPGCRGYRQASPFQGVEAQVGDQQHQ